jgi:conjugal transfer pilus assembly protein TraW
MPYFLTTLLFVSFQIFAKDYGTYGATFDIQEEDFMLVLKNRLEDFRLDEKRKDEWQRAFVGSIENPRGKELPRAKASRKFEYDPTLLIRDDIRDHEGKLIVAKGTTINPLDKHSLREPLLLVDGNDDEQMDWVKIQPGVVILTNEKPLALEKLLNRPIYFDQSGYLTNKLGIKSLPAKVTQNGNKLVVEEVLCI